MSDNLNQLGKSLNKNRDIADTALRKDRPIIPQIERVRDTMDPEIPFTLEFEQKFDGHRVLLDLVFLPPPKTGCCADCSCSICEFFDGGVTETLYLTTYAYIPDTVHVFKNNIEITTFEETDPALSQVTVWAHNNENIVICYVYDVCLGGTTLASFPSECKVYIDNIDCTYWMFGSDTITPTEILHRWREIDISQYVKGSGLHTLKITSTAGVGRVDARVALG